MADSRNGVLERAASGRRVNFLAIKSQANARDAARQGWWAAAWLVVGYALAPVLTPTQNITAEAISVVIFVLFGIALAVAIRQFQPRWASILLLAWTILEVAAKILLVFQLGPFVLVSLGVNVALVLLAARSVHGAVALNRYKRGLGVGEAEGVFD
jgi:hypothetical protein